MTGARLKSGLIWLSLPAIAALWLLFGSRSLEPAGSQPEDLSAAPRYSLKGITWSRYDDKGALQFVAEADTADYFDDESARYDVLRVTVGGEMRTPWQLSSPRGEAPPHQHRLSMSGPVSVTGAWPDGEAVKFETPQLWVDPDKSELTTDAGVDFVSRSRSGQAKRLQAQWRDQTVRLLGNVRMHYGVKR